MELFEESIELSIEFDRIHRVSFKPKELSIEPMELSIESIREELESIEYRTK